MKGKILFVLVLFIIFSLALFFLHPLGLKEERIEVSYSLIEDDPSVDSRISSSYMLGNDLIIEYSSDAEPRIEGLASDRYRIEEERIVAYDYRDEYFKLIFGTSSDIYEFGIRTLEMVLPHLEELKIKEVNSTTHAFKTLSNDVIEIGIVKYSPAMPYLKLNRWEGESSLKVEIPYAEEKLPILRENRLRYSSDKTDIEIYPSYPTEKEGRIINELGGVEFDIILKERPSSNKFEFPIETENLKFYYQPALNKEISETFCNATHCWNENGTITTYRPENVVGSYAVYHSYKMNNEYKTGKAFHIYRPKIIDRNGDWTWANLSIDEEKRTLTVSINQSWLDKAEYPVTIDPNFGYETKGGTEYKRYSVIDGSWFTASAGTAESITVYIKNFYSGARTKFAVYRKSDGALLGYTEEWATTVGWDGWKTLNIVSGGSLAEEDVWLVYMIEEATYQGGAWFYSDSEATKGFYKSYVYGDFPDPLGTCTAYGWKISIYSTYTAAWINKPTITFPTNTTYNTNTVNLTTKCIGSFDGYNINRSLDDGASVTFGFSVANNTDFTNTTTLSSLSDGSHNVYVTCYNGSTTNSSDKVYFTIDAISPFYISSCSVLDQEGATYTLTADILNSGTSYCMNISANNVILDCQGHTIQGNDAADYGIYVYRASSQTANVTIKNCTVNHWDTANIYFENANGNYINDTTSTSSLDYGIYLKSSSNNQIINSTSNNNNYGICLDSSLNNQIINSTSNNNDYGIRLYSSSNNQIINSTLSENSYFDFYIYASSNTDCNNYLESIIGSNNLPIKYYNSSVSLSDEALSELILCNADNSNITNITIDASPTKKNNMLFVHRTDYSNFTQINSSNNYYGIHLYSSSNNQIINSTSNNNNFYGICLDSSLNNQIINSTSNNNDYGIRLYSSSNNQIINSISNNNNYGIRLYSSSNNQIINSTSNNNNYGIRLDSSSNNTIHSNKIEANTKYGIYLYAEGSTPDKIYNNLFNNTNNFYFTATIYANNWNTTKQTGDRIYSEGTEIGGNYWTNSTGNDYSDTCTDADQDGFCDSYYELHATGPNRDYLPLSDEYDTEAPQWFNITVYPESGVTYSPGQSYQFNITWTDNAAISDVILEFNGTNYTYSLGEISKEGNVYYKSFTDLPAGSFSYVWYANDSSNNWNDTRKTFGYETAGGSNDCLAYQKYGNPYAHYVRGTLYSLSEDGNAESLATYLTGDVQMKVIGAIYDSNKNLVAQTEKKTFMADVWNTFSFSSSVSLSAGNYYLVAMGDATTNDGSIASGTSIAYDAGGTGGYSGEGTSTILPDPWNPTSEDRKYSIYLTYKPAYIINKAPTEIKLYLNGTRGDKGYDQYKIANFTAQLNVGGKTIYLTSNMTGWVDQVGSNSVIYNITNLTQYGVFDITAYFEGDANYIADSETWHATVAFVMAGRTTIYLTSYKAWWNDSVTAYGRALYEDQTPVQGGGVVLTVSNIMCNNQTDDAGQWYCSFNAPLELGSYTVAVNVTKGINIFTNSTTLEVKPSYGEKPIGSIDRIVYEVPVLIQELSGRIRRIFARIIIWRG